MAGSTVQLRWADFQLPRRGEEEKCEDAFAVHPLGTRFAIADGASESDAAGLWAELLVKGFVDTALGWPDWILPVQDRWKEQVRRPEDAEPLPWYLDRRNAQGAFATFLGVVLEDDVWRAWAVGDSCLFHTRDEDLIQAFPLDRSKQFGNTPWLVGSKTAVTQVPTHHCSHTHGVLQPGDHLWLMTDALARWFLIEKEEGRQPWRTLLPILEQSEEAFRDWITQLRNARQIRNDDTTLIGFWWGPNGQGDTP